MIEKYLNGLEIKKDELTAIERNKLLSENFLGYELKEGDEE